MLAFGLLPNIAGIGVFCWLISTLAVYALPFFVAINAGTWALHSGAGLLGTPRRKQRQSNGLPPYRYAGGTQARTLPVPR
jgi:hypothetical protein